MNWILSFIYLIIIFLIYNLVGKVVLELVGYKDIGEEKKIIGGFIIIFFIGFVIGVPCQLLHFSWDIYNYTFLLILYCLKLTIYSDIDKIKSILSIL